MSTRRLPSLTIASAFFLVITAAILILFFENFYRVNPLDYLAHYNFAVSIENGERLILPHVLYHVVLIVIKNTVGIQDPVELTATLLALFRALMGAILIVSIKLQCVGLKNNIVITVITFLFLWTAPIYLMFNAPVFVGYINHLSFHSPTQNLMLIFVVPTSLVALRAISPRPFRNLNQRAFFTLLAILVILLLSLSKPSYSIALLPALGLLVLYRVIRRLPIDWWLLIFGIGVPSLLMLLLQYVVTYSDPQRPSVAVGWLTFFNVYLEGTVDVLTRLALSMVFPSVVYLLHAREARKDDYLTLAWLTFGLSLIWAYLFYETGRRTADGNFVWSSYAAMLVLMFSSLLFLIKQYATQPFKLSWRLALSAAVFLLHVGSGVYAAISVATFGYL